MKILMAGMTDNYGGKETYMINLYRAFVSNGYLVDFITMYHPIAYCDEIKSNGSQIFQIPLRPYGYRKYINSIDQILEKGQYDIVWANKTSLSYFEIMKEAKKYSVPIRIIHSHCTQNMGTKITAVLHFVGKMLIGRYATEFFACSNAAGKYFFHKNINFRIMKNSFNTSLYKYNEGIREKYRDEFKLYEDFTIGHIGRFSQEKNHKKIIDVFCKVLDKHPQSKLILCGTGDLEDEIKEFVRQKDITSQVLFLGRRSDVQNILQMLDVMIFPSVHEALPYALLEAQASSLPCIISSNISDEVIYSDAVTKIDLTESDDSWADQCIKFIGYDRSKAVNTLKSGGYDIHEEANKIFDEFSKRINHK